MVKKIDLDRTMEGHLDSPEDSRLPNAIPESCQGPQEPSTSPALEGGISDSYHWCFGVHTFETGCAIDPETDISEHSALLCLCHFHAICRRGMRAATESHSGKLPKTLAPGEKSGGTLLSARYLKVSAQMASATSRVASMSCSPSSSTSGSTMGTKPDAYRPHFSSHQSSRVIRRVITPCEMT